MTPEPLVQLMFFGCQVYTRISFHACARVLRDYFGEQRKLSWCGDYIIGRTMRNSATNPGRRKKKFLSFIASIPALETVQPWLQCEKMALVQR